MNPVEIILIGVVAFMFASFVAAIVKGVMEDIKRGKEKKGKGNG